MAKAIKTKLSEENNVERFDPEKAEPGTVLVEFRDKNDFSRLYTVGQNVSHFDKDRLEHLQNTGVVKK